MAKNNKIVTDAEEIPTEESAVLIEKQVEQESYFTAEEYCSIVGVSPIIAAGLVRLQEIKKDNTASEWKKILDKFMSWDSKTPFVL